MDHDEGPLAALADVEAQAAAARREAQLAEAAEVAVAGFGDGTLVDRLRAESGARLRLSLRGGIDLEGALVELGSGWLRLESQPHTWVVMVEAVAVIRGLPPGPVQAADGDLTSRLSVRVALRRLIGAAIVLLLRDGRRVEGRLCVVGADYVQVEAHSGARQRSTVPLSALSVVQASGLAGEW